MLASWRGPAGENALCADAPLEVEDPPAPFQPKEPNSEQAEDRLHAMALFAAGHVREARGENEAALRLYQRAFRYDDHSPTILKELLRLSAELDRYEQSVQYALLAVNKVPLDGDALRPLAMVLVRQGEWKQALRLYEVILQDIKPDRMDFTSLTIRQEAGRLYYLTDRLAEGAAVSTPVEKALANPEEFGLTEAQQKELLGEGGLTYHLFAECHLAAGELAAAQACFDLAHKYQPSPGLHGYNLARVKFRAGDLQAALESLHAYFEAKLGSEGSAPYELLEEILKASGSKEAAWRKLQSLQAADPENGSLALYVAQKHLAAEEYAQAEPLLEKLAERDRKRTRDAVQRGLLVCQLKLQHAESLLQTLGQVDAGLLREILPKIVADEKLHKQLWDLARARRATDAPRLPPAGESWVMTQLALAGKDYAAAQEFFKFAQQDQPQKRSELLQDYALRLLRAEQTEEAIALLNKSLEDQALAEQRAGLQELLADALAMNKQYEEALELARLVETNASGQGIPTSRVADLLWRAKQYDEAEQAYLELLNAWRRHPDSESVRREAAEVRQSLSHVCVLREDRAQGAEWLEQILDDYPNHAGALNDLSYLWADQGKHPQRALRMIERALEQQPDNRAFLDTLGWAQFRLGNLEAAKQALLKAIADDEHPDPTILEHLGDVLWELNEFDPARNHWRQALDQLPKEGEEAPTERLRDKLLRQPR